MKTTQAIIGVLVMVCLAQAEAGLPAYFKDCGSKQGQILAASVSGCADTDQQCGLKKGSTVHVVIQFKSGELISNATAVVYGIVAGIPIPFHIPESDGCKSGLSCPVKSGAVVNYKSDIAVLKSYPSVKVVVKWELKDQSTQEIFCALFRSEISS